jgi:activator of HSP90 ATPase
VIRFGLIIPVVDLKLAFACKVQQGVYSPERGIASTPERAKANEFYTSYPVGQVIKGDPPSTTSK